MFAHVHFIGLYTAAIMDLLCSSPYARKITDQFMGKSVVLLQMSM